jgi:hypothetical protein
VRHYWKWVDWRYRFISDDSQTQIFVPFWGANP